MDSKFKNSAHYYEWCHGIITKLYYGAIANNELEIKNAIHQIAEALHLKEGQSLYASETTVEPLASIVRQWCNKHSSWSPSNYQISELLSSLGLTEDLK